MAHKWNHNFPKIAREAGFLIKELSVGHCIDWRFIASIDPYAIVGDKDYEKLDEFIPHIAEVPIGTVLNNRILDPAIGKYFILAQFSIQYLLFCKQFLDETVVEIRNTSQDVQRENNRLERICRKKSEEIVSLQRKLQRAESAHSQQIIYPCSKCTKNFISLELLNAHMARKHVETSTGIGASTGEPKHSGRKLSETDSNLINTIKLELEVKQLKERLNATEKDLMDQRSREQHRCHVCVDERFGKRSPTAERKAVECYSVAIQSNLEDAKDVNEKEVQTSVRSKSETPPRLSPIPRFTPSPTRPALPPVVHSPPPRQPSPTPPPRVPLMDYISKSDLESIIHEQNEQFESWKMAERTKFNSEIEQVRRSLTNAIQELEKRDRMVAIETPNNRSEEDENIWKKRYQELEQMYESSQRQVRETVDTIESAYEEKFRRIEQMVKLQREVKSDSKESSRKVSASSLLQIPVAKIDLKASLPPVPSRTEEGLKMNEIDVQEDKTTSDETDQSESDEEIRALEATKAKLLHRPGLLSIPQENTKVLPVTNKDTEKQLIAPKKLIMNTFKTRLKQLGIDTRTKTISKEDLNAASVVLAERRDICKKKNRGFFITRNQLMTKVDQLAKSRMNEEVPKPRARHKTDDQPIIKKREAPPQPVPKLRSTFQVSEKHPVIDILPSKLKLANEERSSISHHTDITSNLFKTRPVPEIKLTSDDVITVQAEINPLAESLSRSPVPSVRTSPRPSLSEHDRHLERLLDTPVKRLSPPSPDVIGAVEACDGRHARDSNDSDLSDILEAVPLQPKPIPKKRVLFNLDRHNDGGGMSEKLDSGMNLTKQMGPPLSSTVIHVSKVEEDSDWNISSFDEEK